MMVRDSGLLFGATLFNRPSVADRRRHC